MRDDIHKLGLPKEAVRYARRKGLGAMRRQPQEYIDMVAAVTGQKDRQRGFRNKDAGQKS